MKNLYLILLLFLLGCASRKEQPQVTIIESNFMYMADTSLTDIAIKPVDWIHSDSLIDRIMTMEAIEWIEIVEEPFIDTIPIKIGTAHAIAIEYGRMIPRIPSCGTWSWPCDEPIEMVRVVDSTIYLPTIPKK